MKKKIDMKKKLLNKDLFYNSIEHADNRAHFVFRIKEDKSMDINSKLYDKSFEMLIKDLKKFTSKYKKSAIVGSLSIKNEHNTILTPSFPNKYLINKKSLLIWKNEFIQWISEKSEEYNAKFITMITIKIKGIQIVEKNKRHSNVSTLHNKSPP